MREQFDSWVQALPTTVGDCVWVGWDLLCEIVEGVIWFLIINTGSSGVVSESNLSVIPKYGTFVVLSIESAVKDFRASPCVESEFSVVGDISSYLSVFCVEGIMVVSMLVAGVEGFSDLTV